MKIKMAHHSIYSTLFAAAAVVSAPLVTPFSARCAPAVDPQSILDRGRDAFMNYDFDAAARHYADYAARIRKAKMEADPEFESLQQSLEMARRQMERVQDIVVIDSIAVPALDFFKNIRVPASAGFLLPSSEIPFKEGREAASMAFVPESQSLMMWAQPDSLGVYRIVESARLTDGRYTEPVYAPEILNAGGDVDFPVLSADGLTLYFSGDGEESMGGYDIFETVRDAQTGEYMPPSNVGMPFNSPYDDFILVTDEENGVGWWATDRNQLGDLVTLYVYMLPEMRRNLDAERDDITDRARLADFRATWPDSESDTVDYEALAAEIRRIRPGERPKADEFYLPVGGGKIYTRYDQLPDARTRALVKGYEEARIDFEKRESELSEMRRQYDASRDRSLGLRIQETERAVAAQREKLRVLLSDVYRGLR